MVLSGAEKNRDAHHGDAEIWLPMIQAEALQVSLRGGGIKGVCHRFLGRKKSGTHTIIGAGFDCRTEYVDAQWRSMIARDTNGVCPDFSGRYRLSGLVVWEGGADAVRVCRGRCRRASGRG